MASDSRQIIIIGGGIGGLAAAIRLGAAGVRVTLLEKNERVGGKMNLWEVSHPHRQQDPPFRFDTGPSLLTLPFVFEDLFAAAGERLSDHLELRRLDPIARYTWDDGTTFEARGNAAERLAGVSRISPADADGWTALEARGREIWDLSAELFLFQSPEQALRGPLTLAGIWRALSLPIQIGMFQNFAAVVNAKLTHPRLREILYQYATYSGASPFRAPATLAVIPHAEFHFGGWYPVGGMYRLAEELERLAKRVGVTIRTETAVNQILIDAGKPPRARGVRLTNGEELPGDAVLANSDVIYTYRHLIGSQFRTRYPDKTLDRIEPGGSGMALLLGVEGTYPKLAHHNKFMPADYRSDLVAMFERKTIPVDPCIYVCASTRTDPTQAPDNCENLFILASAPSLDGSGSLDWSRESRRYRDQLVRTLQEKWGLNDLNQRIIVERCLTPADLQSLYNANAGSIYGIGSNSRRSAFLRPPNRDRDIRSLYFAGGATHPGGGLPLVALSGKIASELILQDFNL